MGKNGKVVKHDSKSDAIPNNVSQEVFRKNLKGNEAIILSGVAIVLALFCIYALGFTVVTPIILRSLFLLGSSILIFIALPLSKRSDINHISFLDLSWIIISIISFGYILKEGNNLLWRIGMLPTRYDVIFGFLIILITLEITRRCIGWVLPIIATVFFVYAMIGPYIPGYFGHHGYSFVRIVGYVMGLDGVLGLPLGVASTYVFLFLIFGSFLNTFGGSGFFIDLATSLFGHSRGGPAKIAIIASSLFGMISGSAVANTVGTGSFTIPLMKKIGYKPEFAGAVEAVASTGGQIMPPIMGAGAFVIADIVGIPYISVAAVAIIPALLYYICVFSMVDLEAVNIGLVGIPRNKLPNLKKIILSQGYLFIPVLVLVYLLVVVRTSPIRAALMSIFTMFLIGVIVKVIQKKFSEILILLKDALKKASLDAMVVTATCACAGIVVGIVGLTGLGLKLANLIISLGENNLFLALIASMVVAAILGMGVPTTPAYIVGAAVVAPALIRLGILPIQSHLFTFYFACIAVITPPVALAAYAAAAIAKADPMAVGFQALKLAVFGFIIPYLFVYNPLLLGIGDLKLVIYNFILYAIAVMVTASVLQRRFFGILRNIFLYLFLIIGVVLLIIPGMINDLIGLILIVAVAIYQRSKQKK